MTDVKLSQISNGGAFVPGTDKVVTVRNSNTDVLTVLGTAAAQNVGAFLQTANNLSDIASASAARVNLGLGSAAVQNSSAFLQPGNNLSDVSSPATSRTNLGLNTPETAINIAATTDLGTSASTNILVNGAGTISSFGSSASLNKTDYTLRFNGAVNFTNSASLVCPNGVNFAVVSGSSALVRYLGSGNWIFLNVFQFGNGSGTLNPSGTITANSLAFWAGGTTLKAGDLTGDVTTSGGAAATIATHAVTLGKMATGTANFLIGYDGSGNAAAITVSTGLNLAAGVLTATGGGGGVSSINSSDSSLTISPATGSALASINVAHANSWTASQSFNNGTANSFDIHNPSGAFFTNGSPAACMAFAHGRLFVGEAVVNLGSSVGSTGSEWCEALSANTTTISQFASVSRISGIGVLGASRSSDEGSGNPGSQGTQGVTAIINQDNSAVATSAYAFYGEAHKASGAHANGIAQAMELAVITLQSGAPNTDPYSYSVAGLVEGLRVGAGKIGTGEQLCSTAMVIANVGGTSITKFKSGLIIGADAISSVGGIQQAIMMGQSHSMCWYTGAGVLGPLIRSDVTGTNNGLRQIFANNGFFVQDPVHSNNLFQVGNVGGVGTIYVNNVPLGKSALVYQTGAQSVANSTTTTISFNAAEHDPLNLWNGTSGLVVPTGVSLVKISAGIAYSSNVVSGNINIKKNGGTFPGQGNSALPSSNAITTVSGPVSVSGGEVFTMTSVQNSGGTINTSGNNNCWLCMEIIG